jgi:HK97 family phage prohead protease
MEIQKREDTGDGDLYLEGYFAVFNSVYELWPGATESIARGAFEETIRSDDIRALYNHDANIVLGRNKSATLVLSEDDHGLYGKIKINRDDSDAMNAHSRVQRGDVTQCSFGFDIEKETTEVRDDGSVHWTIEKVKLWEISPCVFPAYEETNVSARKHDFEEIQKRKLDKWREDSRKKLGGK